MAGKRRKLRAGGLLAGAAGLVIVPGAGHLVQLKEPDVIDEALVRLVERATPRRVVLNRGLGRKAGRSD